MYCVTHQLESVDLLDSVWGDSSTLLLDDTRGLFTATGNRWASKCGFCCSICSVSARSSEAKARLKDRDQQTGNLEGKLREPLVVEQIRHAQHFLWVWHLII